MGWRDVLEFAFPSQILTIFALGFLPPSNPLRLPIAAIVAFRAWLFCQFVQGQFESRMIVALLSAAMWIQSVKTFVDLCLTKLSYDREDAVARGRTYRSRWSSMSTQTSFSDTMGSRFQFGLRNLWNMRGIGTTAQIAVLPPWSTEDPKFIPSPEREVHRHLKNIILSYLVLELFSFQPSPDMKMLARRNEGLFGRLSEITAEEAIFRFFFTIGFWVNSFCIIQFINSLFCLVYVGFEMYPVRQVPPIWGRLSDAYSVRQFWGKTWHQTLRRPLTSVSNFIMHDFLRFRKGSLFARYSKLLICFLISGAFHYPADLALGIPATQSNAITFFATTALVIMLEDGIQHIFHRIGGGGSKWSRYLGYAWVCCYLYWLTPAWGFPAARVVRPRDRLVSFSIGKTLINLVK